MHYSADTARLPPVLARSFVPLERDADTADFLRWCTRNRLSLRRVIRLGRAYAAGVSKYDTDAREQAYRMFLLSDAQWRTLLEDLHAPRALDIGAGQGFITERLKDFAETMHATEIGPHLCEALAKRGIAARALDLAESTGDFERGSFGLIFLLNVLDRTSRPRALLKAAETLLSKDGTLVIAAPLPHRSDAAGADALVLQDRRMRWEDAAADFYDRVLAPLNLEPVRWSRAPYISQGTVFTPYYLHDDAVFVLRRAVSEI